MNTYHDQTEHAWVIDSQSSSVLLYQHQPAVIHLSHHQLALLDGQYAKIQPTATHIADDTADSIMPITHVIDKRSLIHAKLLTPLDRHRYRFGQDVFDEMAYRAMVGDLPMAMLCQLSCAIQLIRHHKEHRFCGCCGTKMHSDTQEYANVCPTCHHRSYPSIQPCVIVAVLKKCPQTHNHQILLALHHRHYQKDKPDSSMYGLVAGFVEMGESLETAVMRETQEETGIGVKNIRYIGSQTWPYPSNIMIGFVADYDGGVLRPQADELMDARFFDLHNLPVIPKTGTIARTLIDWVLAHYPNTNAP